MFNFKEGNQQRLSERFVAFKNRLLAKIGLLEKNNEQEDDE